MANYSINPRHPPVGAKCTDPYSPLFNQASRDSDEYKPRYPLPGAFDPYAPPPRKTYGPGMESLHKRMIPKIQPVLFKRRADDPFSNPDIPALVRRRAARVAKVEVDVDTTCRSESEDEEIQTPHTSPVHSANASFVSVDAHALVPVYHDKIYDLQQKADQLRRRIDALAPTTEFWNRRGDYIMFRVEIMKYQAHRWPAEEAMQMSREIEMDVLSLAEAVRFLAYYKKLKALLEENLSALRVAKHGHKGVEGGDEED